MLGVDLEAGLVKGQLESLKCQVGIVLWIIGATGDYFPEGHDHSYILEKASQWSAQKLGWEVGVVVEAENVT